MPLWTVLLEDDYDLYGSDGGIDELEWYLYNDDEYPGEYDKERVEETMKEWNRI